MLSRGASVALQAGRVARIGKATAVTRRCRLLSISDGKSRVSPGEGLFDDYADVEQIPYSAQSIRAALEGSFDLVLLDGRTDPQRGLQICRGLRAVDELRSTPIVMLTRSEDSSARLAALEAGADDCVSQSLGAREFMLRLQAAVRRNGMAEDGRQLNYADLELDLQRFKVRRNGATIYLPAMQFRLLRHFLEHPTVVFSRRQLLEQVWKDTSIDERSVNVAIVRLRRAINSRGGPNLIRSVPGMGYALDVEADA